MCSLLYNYVYFLLDSDIRTLEIFCDSCAGQNKNYTVFRFLHKLVHVHGRFEKIKMTFPVRGHSYLECDKNMGLVNQKLPAETPNDWAQIFREARTRPCPFTVVEVHQNTFLQWTEFLDPL